MNRRRSPKLKLDHETLRPLTDLDVRPAAAAAETNCPAPTKLQSGCASS